MSPALHFVWILAAALAGVVASPAPSRAPAQVPRPATDPLPTSDRCLACHRGVSDAAGRDVSIGFEWRASMMANSSRDPYWQASVRREVTDNPSLGGAIEDECATCHMPLARTSARARGRQGRVLDLLPWRDPPSPEGPLAADGVSCALCHRVSPDGLGEAASFSGGYVVARPDDGPAPAFGPFEPTAGHARIMESATALRPTLGGHVQRSELCATCHTLFTNAVDEAGNEVGKLPEQVPYLEWRASDFVDEASCQDCHMPEVAGAVPVTGVVPVPRPAVSRHVFLGGNFFMQRMLNRFRDELGVVALPQELELAALRTERHLATSAASLEVLDVQRNGSVLAFDVVVLNLAGHKLPTAYPSRRAWLHVRVRDGSGATVFESGAVAPDGSIEGNDHDADPDRFEPHHVEVRSPDQVQIYESIMVGVDGRPTTALLRGVRYAKDNRVAPRGFDVEAADDAVAVRGGAADDADFRGGEDRVRYRVDLPGAAGPLGIEVTLRYQPIGYRWATNLGTYTAEETQRFTRYWDAMAETSSTVLAAAQVRVPR